VEGRGATLIAISPQAPEARIRCDAPEPPFPLLFDSEAKVARRCGIAFTLSEELRPIYTGAGRRLPSEGRDMPSLTPPRHTPNSTHNGH
jgi:peroxiredoxin